ncbi:Uncharacterised protein [Salmonella enterica subsp. enterica serovar Typhi]|nr:Uncharacterised protein [Salmonella enterica subsp. enterica serovar Typhi]CIM10620.1 Uncharacterised protein [Salmonella enterica subsp. enterica serovar Typhi]
MTAQVIAAQSTITMTIEIKEIYCFHEISNFRGMIKFMPNVVISNFSIRNRKNILCA